MLQVLTAFLTYIYYEFVHDVHNKEKMKNRRIEKNNNTIQTTQRHQIQLSSAQRINRCLKVCQQSLNIWCLRFSSDADIVRLTNARIIIIINDNDPDRTKVSSSNE